MPAVYNDCVCMVINFCIFSISYFYLSITFFFLFKFTYIFIFFLLIFILFIFIFSHTLYCNCILHLIVCHIIIFTFVVRLLLCLFVSFFLNTLFCVNFKLFWIFQRCYGTPTFSVTKSSRLQLMKGSTRTTFFHIYIFFLPVADFSIYTRIFLSFFISPCSIAVFFFFFTMRSEVFWTIFYFSLCCLYLLCYCSFSLQSKCL